jgi:phospholipase A-2-activating protein
LQIGTVVEGEGTGTSKKLHEGKEYDYVFDIDIEDGKPPLKLPYNLTESSWDAARRFLERNELPLSYYEQVANWITENTQGARIGQGSGQGNQSAPPQGHDPWGTERRYRPGDVPSSSGPRKLPQRSYISIVEGNPANAINITLQNNEAGELSPEQSLLPDEVAVLKSLPPQLQNKQDPKPTPDQINALLKVASQGPSKSRVPAVGVLAVLAVSPDFVSATSAGGKTIVDIIAASGLLEPRQETPNNVVHTIRLLANLFKSAPGTKLMHENLEQILKLARPFGPEPESPAQAKALATLYLNYAVLLSSTTLATDREARAKVLVNDLAFQLESDSPHASDADALYRTLSALGTLISVSDGLKKLLKDGIAGSLYAVTSKPAAQLPNTKELIQEIRDALR